MTTNHDTLILLLVVAVLSTLLIVVVLGCLSWIFFKCCIQSVWFRKPRHWTRQSCYHSFPPPQREIVEMTELGHGRERSAIENSHFAPGRTGISERLGYGRSNMEASVPYLPPPRSWTPSPPFPPSGPLPPRPHPIRPKPRLLKDQEIQVQVEDEMMVATSINKEKHARTQCQYCGKVQLCPVELGEKLRTVEIKPKRSFKRTKFASSNSMKSSLRPPNNTPDKNFSGCCIVNPELERSKRNLENEAEYEICDDEPRAGPSERHGRNGDLHLHTRGSSLVHSLRYQQGSRSANDPHKQVVNDISNHPSFSSSDHDDDRRIDRHYNLHHQAEELFTRLPLDRSNNLAKDTAKDLKLISGSGLRGTRRKRGIRNREQNEKLRSVTVLVESPSSSTSDVTEALSRSQKTYWRIYHHPPKGETTIYNEDVEDEKESVEDAEAQGEVSDAEPSMSWDHLTPDPSPGPEVDGSMLEGVRMNFDEGKAFYYTAKNKKNNLYPVKNSRKYSVRNKHNSNSLMNQSVAPMGRTNQENNRIPTTTNPVRID